MTDVIIEIMCDDCSWRGDEIEGQEIEACPSCGSDDLLDMSADEHITCQSYPNCEDAPDGCDIATGMSFLDR